MTATESQPRKLDHGYWKNVYLASELTLQELSCEPNAPTYGTLRKWAMASHPENDNIGWKEQRENNGVQPINSEIPGVRIAVDKIDMAIEKGSQLLDRLEIIERHGKAAKGLGAKALTVIKNTPVDQIKITDAIALLKLAFDREDRLMSIVPHSADSLAELALVQEISGGELARAVLRKRNEKMQAENQDTPNAKQA